MHILYIPIISSRSYVDNKFDLETDGNFQQFLCFMSELKPEYADILLPELEQLTDNSLPFIEKTLKALKGEGIEMSVKYKEFPENAKAQRESYTLFDKVVNLNTMYHYDQIICVPTALARALADLVEIEYLTFYIPVSGVKWLEWEDDLRREAYEACDETWVATKEQLKEFPEATVLDSFIPNFSYIRKKYNTIEIFDNCPEEYRDWIIQLSEKMYVYFPFRLTDKGYQATRVFKFIHEHFPDVKLVYTDPNETIIDVLGQELYGEMSSQLLKSPTDSNVHLYHLAFGNCVVPYFEDAAVKHVGLDEMRLLHTNVAYLISALGSYLDLPKTNLVIFDGFDEVGKSYQRVNIAFDHPAKYIDGMMEPDIVETLFDTSDKTTFKDKESQMRVISDAWLKNLNLYSYFRNVIAERLWLADNVYSEMFNRQSQMAKIEKAVKAKYNVKTICLLWKSYSDFVMRCEALGKEPEYSMLEFLDIQHLYRTHKDDSTIILTVSALDTKDEIEEKIMSYLK